MAHSTGLLITSSILVQIGWTDYGLENSCPVEDPMSFQQKRHILHDHNFYRSHIAQGIGIHPESNKLPGGSNIYRLVRALHSEETIRSMKKWNCRLETLASAAVYGCQPEPTVNQLYGQNYALDLSNAGSENPYNTARDIWISSVFIESPVINNNAVVFSGETEAQSFANMIRGNSTSIGCSQKQCGQFMAVACFYNSPNIKNGSTIYELGKQCKNDSDCTAHKNSNCDVEKGLCVVEQESQEVEDGYSFFFSDNSHSSTRLIKITSENIIVKNLNGFFIHLQYILEMIISIEDHRLRKRYNCALEAIAHTRAAKCLLTENYSAEENGGNSAIIHQEVAVTFAGAIRWAIQSWWKQIAEHENVMGKRVIYRNVHAQHPIRHFVQMAWAKTKEVGCGIVKCGEVHNFVCRYSPSGNIIRQAIYDVGTQCTNCPRNTTCDQEMALCEQISDNTPSRDLQISLLFILYSLF